MNKIRRLFLKLFVLTGAAMSVGQAHATSAKLRYSPPKERTPPKTAQELYDMMCSVLPVGQSTRIGWSVTGEKYIEYAASVNIPFAMRSAIQPEAAACDWAWRMFLKQAMAHDVNPRTTTLYWRIKPEFVHYTDNLAFNTQAIIYPIDIEHGVADTSPAETEIEKGRIYLRYLISSRPAIYTEDMLIGPPLRPWPKLKTPA